MKAEQIAELRKDAKADAKNRKDNVVASYAKDVLELLDELERLQAENEEQRNQILGIRAVRNAATDEAYYAKRELKAARAVVEAARELSDTNIFDWENPLRKLTALSELIDAYDAITKSASGDNADAVSGQRTSTQGAVAASNSDYQWHQMLGTKICCCGDVDCMKWSKSASGSDLAPDGDKSVGEEVLSRIAASNPCPECGGGGKRFGRDCLECDGTEVAK